MSPIATDKAWWNVLKAASKYCSILDAFSTGGTVYELDVAMAESALQAACLRWAKLIIKRDGKKAPPRP